MGIGDMTWLSVIGTIPVPKTLWIVRALSGADRNQFLLALPDSGRYAGEDPVAVLRIPG